jgi:hypothetical protein
MTRSATILIMNFNDLLARKLPPAEAEQEDCRHPHMIYSKEFSRLAMESRKKIRAISPLRLHLSLLLRRLALHLTLWAIALERQS